LRGQYVALELKKSQFERGNRLARDAAGKPKFAYDAASSPLSSAPFLIVWLQFAFEGPLFMKNDIMTDRNDASDREVRASRSSSETSLRDSTFRFASPATGRFKLDCKFA
jgi:hypothetical protein